MGVVWLRTKTEPKEPQAQPNSNGLGLFFPSLLVPVSAVKSREEYVCMPDLVGLGVVVRLVLGLGVGLRVGPGEGPGVG